MKKVLFALFLASIVCAGCKKAEMAPAPETTAPVTAPAVLNSTDAVTTPAVAPAATPATK